MPQTSEFSVCSAFGSEAGPRILSPLMHWGQWEDHYTERVNMIATASRSSVPLPEHRPGLLQCPNHFQMSPELYSPPRYPEFFLQTCLPYQEGVQNIQLLCPFIIGTNQSEWGCIISGERRTSPGLWLPGGLQQREYPFSPQTFSSLPPIRGVYVIFPLRFYFLSSFSEHILWQP